MKGKGRNDLTTQFRGKAWALHLGNVSSNFALFVKRFLAKYCILVLEHWLYLLDIEPFNFKLFSYVKSALKPAWFEFVKAGKEKAVLVLKGLTQKDFQRYFEHRKIRMQIYRDRAEVYIEGDN
ncbi:hypothetical protein TNCV_5128981 [Trichonephila clavipes]|nr:hypothetical protein TNCV_5128981 [Trichonephila clavipes]